MMERLPTLDMVPEVTTLAAYDELSFLSMRTDNEKFETIRGREMAAFLVDKCEEEVQECIEPSASYRRSSYSRLAVLNGHQDPPDCAERDNQARELGDVLWCFSRAMESLDSSLQDAADWWVDQREGRPADGTFEQLDKLVTTQENPREEIYLTEDGAIVNIEEHTAQFFVARFAAFREVAQTARANSKWSLETHERLVASGGALLSVLGWIAHNRFGLTLQSVAQQNVYKVCVRNANGSVFGKGDNIDR